MTRLPRTALRLLSLAFGLLIALGALLVAGNQGWLSAVGITSTSHDSQVVRAIERTQEVSLLSLGVQGIKEEHRNSTIFGKSIPGTREKVFLKYEFSAKLGIDGAKVEVTKTGEKAYRISVPEFILIGYADPTFKVAVEDKGILSWVTPDIDQVKMVNDIFDADAQQSYIASNGDLLQSQAMTFYSSLVAGIDPEIVTTFEFRS